jgi:hypothetical protein
MKVYVVIYKSGDCYDGYSSDIEGVFCSEEKANDFINRQTKEVYRTKHHEKDYFIAGSYYDIEVTELHS